ncbi:hypothetical protein CRG98_034901 [Punica granatum]|uniref:Uncharacterized protein n=1 Tax=Punica granatum TaxID=22663 RepID=A0A2I0IL42_PUNGR|nr:hypothetical protein CRG98_034901 [Punica granatum]
MPTAAHTNSKKVRVMPFFRSIDIYCPFVDDGSPVIYKYGDRLFCGEDILKVPPGFLYDATAVGVGTKEIAQKLDDDYGIKIPKMCELRDLAAKFYGKDDFDCKGFQRLSL